MCRNVSQKKVSKTFITNFVTECHIIGSEICSNNNLILLSPPGGYVFIVMLCFLTLRVYRIEWSWTKGHATIAFCIINANKCNQTFYLHI